MIFVGIILGIVLLAFAFRFSNQFAYKKGYEAGREDAEVEAMKGPTKPLSECGQKDLDDLQSRLDKEGLL